MNHAFEFIYNNEIGIETPVLHIPYEELSEKELADLHHKMEKVSGQIPERLKELEQKYKEMYKQFSQQDNDSQFYEGMNRINELSRKIGELNIWYLKMQGKHLTSYQG